MKGHALGVSSLPRSLYDFNIWFWTYSDSGMFCCSFYGRYWKCDIKRSTTDKLVGKKIGVKDNVAVVGVPMMNGSKILEGFYTRIRRYNNHLPKSSWSWSYSCWIYNHPYNQCLSPLILWVQIPLMAKCTWYNIIWSSLSVTCNRSEVIAGYSGFLHKSNWLPRYNWNIVESCIKHN